MPFDGTLRMDAADLARRGIGRRRDGRIVPTAEQLAWSLEQYRQRQYELRGDAQFVPVVSKALTNTMAEVLRAQYPELPMANGDVIPHFAPGEVAMLGDKAYEYLIIKHQGFAKILKSYGASQIPRVTLSGRTATGRVYTFGMAWGITRDEMMAAASQRRNTGINLSLETEKAFAARRAHLQNWHAGGLWGEDGHPTFAGTSLVGLVNHPNMTVVAAAPSISNPGSTSWEDKTGAEVIADLRQLIETPPNQTNRVEFVDRVYLSGEKMTFMATTLMGAGDNTTTILEFAQKAFGRPRRNGQPAVTFHELEDLSPNASQGNLDGYSALALRFDKAVAGFVVTEQYTQHEPQIDGLDTVVITTSGHGATLARRPLAMARLDGI